MVLLLRDWRSVIVVVVNIPLALVGAMVALWLCDQTINLMTLGGLALAVGILVDEATVEVENIHSQMEQGHPVARAVRLGNAETAVPRLLAMLCILAVFIPSFLMEGSRRALFVPLSLAVAFAMVTSYFLLQYAGAGAVGGCGAASGRQHADGSADNVSGSASSAFRARPALLRLVFPLRPGGPDRRTGLSLPCSFPSRRLVIGSAGSSAGSLPDRRCRPDATAMGGRRWGSDELTKRVERAARRDQGDGRPGRTCSYRWAGPAPTRRSTRSTHRPEGAGRKTAGCAWRGGFRGVEPRPVSGRAGAREWKEKKYRTERVPDEEDRGAAPRA